MLPVSHKCQTLNNKQRQRLGMCMSHHAPCSKVQRIPPAAAAAAVAAASAPAMAEEGGGLLDFGKVGVSVWDRIC